MPKVSINTPAPDFALQDIDGKTVRLSDFRGKAPVLLVFNRTFT
jgi:peroxiredoxin